MLFDCPSFRSYITANFECFFRGRDGHLCDGVRQFHHEPFVSSSPRNYSDLNGTSLCVRAHRLRHDEKLSFENHSEEFKKRKQEQIESFISSIVQAGAPEAVTRKRKTTTRRPLSDFEHFENPFKN